MKNILKGIVLGLIVLHTISVQGETLIHGRVLRLPDSIPLAFANVGNMSAHFAEACDENGRFSIQAHTGDTLFFSYVGFFTGRMVIEDTDQDLRIFLKPESRMLEEVNIFGITHRSDSLQTRKDFKKFYEWHPVQPSELLTGGGISIDKLYELVQFRKNKRKEYFRNYLIQEEKEKYVDYRFNEEYVAGVTSLHGDSLQEFMTRFRPPYELASQASEYDFYEYVRQACHAYERGTAMYRKPE